MTGCGIALELAEMAGLKPICSSSLMLWSRKTRTAYSFILVDCSHSAGPSGLRQSTPATSRRHRMQRADRNGHRGFPSGKRFCAS